MRLLNGHFHEEDEEEEEVALPENEEEEKKGSAEQNEAHLAQMKKFEDQLKNIMAPKEFVVTQDEVPRNIR